MSTIGDISSNLVILIDKLNEYDDYLEKAAPIFEMEGKKLEVLNRQLPKALSFYDRKLGEIKTIEDLIQMKIKEIESSHWKKYNEKYPRSLTTQDIRSYIAGEKDYIQMYEILLEVVNMKRQYEAVTDALRQMGWSLKNIVELRIAQLEMVEI